jgi:hypothetical protein
MTKAEKLLSKECNRYVNGKCFLTKCFRRADYKEATCEIHEAILEVREIEKIYDNFCKSAARFNEE